MPVVLIHGYTRGGLEKGVGTTALQISLMILPVTLGLVPPISCVALEKSRDAPSRVE